MSLEMRGVGLNGVGTMGLERTIARFNLLDPVSYVIFRIVVQQLTRTQLTWSLCNSDSVVVVRCVRRTTVYCCR